MQNIQLISATSNTSAAYVQRTPEIRQHTALPCSQHSAHNVQHKVYATQHLQSIILSKHHNIQSQDSNQARNNEGTEEVVDTFHAQKHT